MKYTRNEIKSYKPILAGFAIVCVGEDDDKLLIGYWDGTNGVTGVRPHTVFYSAKGDAYIEIKRQKHYLNEFMRMQ